MKAKIMKSKITNKLWLLSGFIFLFTLVSCSNLLTKDLEQASDGKTYLVINSDNVSINSRTISPTAEYVQDNLTGIYLYAKKIKDGNGNSVSLTEKTLAGGTALKLSDLYRKVLVLEDGGGTYTIRMTAKLDDVYFYKQKDVEIEENQTNPITIELDPVKSSSELGTSFGEYGGFSFTINANVGTANKDIDSIYVTLEHLGTNQIIDQRYINRQTRYPKLSNQTVYQHLAKNAESTEKDSNGRIPAGTYRLTLDFLALDQSLGKDILVNSFPYILNVEEGRNTYYEETFDLNQVLSITYNDNSGSLAPGERKRTKFTSKDEVILPKMQRDGYAFAGWYKNSDYSGQVFETVEKGTLENQKFYAKFIPSTIYVDANGNDEKDGSSSTNALKTLSKAVEKITEANDSEREWYIYMSGEFTEPQTIAGNFNSENNYRETIPAKAINILGNNAILHSTPTATALTIMTETPVTLRDIEIDGNYTGNTGIAMGFDDQTYESINSNVTLGSGVYVHENLASDVDVINGKVNLYGFVRIDRLTAEGTNQVVLLDDLSSDASITIMLEDYREPYIWETEVNKTQLVSFDKNIINFGSNSAYFHVPPESTPDGAVEWFIDEEGCLNKECTISFTGEGATSMSDVSVGMYTPISSDDSQFQIPARSGYEFAGWYYLYDEQRYTGSEYVHVRYIMNPFDFKDSTDDSDFTHIESDMTLYAAWRYLGSSDIYVNADTGADGVYVDTQDATAIYFGDGSKNHPLRTLNSAFDLIKEINDATEDYTITISGFTNEHDLPINSELPVNSLTLQGSSSAETDGIKASNISVSVLPVSTTKPVTIRNMLINLSNVSYAVEGAVMNIGNGSTVTLEEGTIFEGPSSSVDSKGAVAIENGGTLIMQNDVTFQKFDIKCGAVNVKTGGTFTMNGGTFTNNESNGTCGAVYVNGGTFTMKDGYIKDNWQDAFQRANALPQGAGVCVASGTFIMEGGHITGNKSCVADGHDNMTTAGGGVFVYADGEFIMRGGEISDNHAYNQKISVDGKIYEEIDTTAHSYGGGVCLQASGNKIASFTMTGGTISGNTAGTSGNGIGFLGSLDDGKTGTISLGANAIITDNDIYLPSNITITIVEPMTGGLTPSIRATITPQEYAANQPILNDNGVSLEYEYDYFAVTPQVTGEAGNQTTTNWEIDNTGKLKLSGGGGNGGSVPNDLAYLTGTNGAELESDTYWDGEGTRTVGNLYVGKTEITQAEYEKYMTYETGYSPTETGTDKSTYPAYFVSWNEAIIYCNLRSINEGLIPYYSMDGETDPRKWTDAGVVTTNGKCYLPVANITISTYETAGNNGMWEPTYVNAGGHLKFAEDSTDEGHYGYRLPCGAEWCYIAANSSSLGITDLTTKNVDEWVQAWDEMGSSVGHYHVSGSINGTYDEDYDFTTDVNSDAVPNYAHEGTANIGFRVVRNADANSGSNP